MGKPLERKELEILDILREAGRPVGARLLSQMLVERGIELNERTIRYHLLLMDERGLTRLVGERGRVPTEKGLQELEKSQAAERVGFVSSRIDSLAYQTDFDLRKGTGKIVINLSLIPARELHRSLELMRPVINSGYCLSDLILVATEGERIGEAMIPEGKVGIGTVCSVTLNGLLLHNSVPVASRFGGLLEIVEGKPSRFIEIVSYDGSTLDPIEIFIKGKMTKVTEASRKGKGVVCASFRDIPSDAIYRVLETIEQMKKFRLQGAIYWGKPSQPFLEVPVGRGRLGLVVAGGLNPIAAVEEAGVSTENKAMAALMEYSKLKPIAEVTSRG
jgi:hypothetical protein